MSDKYCIEYNKLVRDITTLAEPVGYDVLVNPDATLTVVKKPKPRVKVEWRQAMRIYSGDLYPPGDWDHDFYLIQFYVSDWNRKNASVREAFGFGHIRLSEDSTTAYQVWADVLPDLYIGLDAKDKWSVPMLLPELLYNKLPEICGALEEKANKDS